MEECNQAKPFCHANDGRCYPKCTDGGVNQNVCVCINGNYTVATMQQAGGSCNVNNPIPNNALTGESLPPVPTCAN